ncbi:hypothetical protein TWF225_002770 [Orbilia oligospora]|uniref:Uncharacterized protein n=1 Tax=Orbilia oligospora TaxID=2813651 RepID=A0A7C8PP94_ORBOL|nr:hypothetical protein TWF751_003946 [Orbilia oligospora]KAF3189630.1 hypothetical protein TWF225_002770 [Orbilia oligospora]KAF3238018.1 hypothetical protein TWF217_001812 [Orbilia oligospora]KAF3253753.1 hypothetical protein TWF128_006375 [Orbilia oligospora]KAF3297886.1 hypothetical protein TWF132_004035 [Orbilia oligospora]
MPHSKRIILLLLLFLTTPALSVDLTEVVPTLTSFGSLPAFTPPANCFSRSIWSTSRFYDNVNSASTFVTRFFTRWYIGCNTDKVNGGYNTCCPPKYNTWGFYAPGACPGGYTSLLNVAANPWIGDQRGTVCCPDIKSPAGTTLGGAGFATSFINPLARDPISISCFEWDDDVSTSGTVFQANYNARAIIVFGEEVTGTFQFLGLTDDSGTATRATSPASSSSVQNTPDPESTSSTSENISTSTNTPSPGSTTPPIPSQTESSISTTSLGKPTSTSQSNDNDNNGGSGKKQLSGGAIAGIVIGVAIPVIAIIAFIAYRMGRNKQDVPSIPIHNDPENKEMGFGGVQEQRQWQ